MIQLLNYNTNHRKNQIKFGKFIDGSLPNKSAETLDGTITKFFHNQEPRLHDLFKREDRSAELDHTIRNFLERE